MEIVIGLIVVVVVIAVVALLVLSQRSGTAPAVRDDRAAKDEAGAAETVSLRSRLGRTRSALGGALSGAFSAPGGVAWDDLEDALILADLGPATAADVVARVKERRPSSEGEAAEALAAELRSRLASTDRALGIVGRPAVIVVVGVNGSGKTTTIGKLAKDLSDAGSSVVLAAADTFRAAADSQLIVWGERAGIDVVSGSQGQDPASVAFAAVDRARTEGTDVVIIDTAGRLHGQTNLMEELGKIVRVASREAGSVGEVLLVLDGSTGQNGIAQASAFTEAVGVTGVALTKLDGTAKGGVAVAVEADLGIPIKYIGVGEGIDDLIPFDPDAFVEALLAP